MDHEILSNLITITKKHFVNSQQIPSIVACEQVYLFGFLASILVAEPGEGNGVEESHFLPSHSPH